MGYFLVKPVVGGLDDEDVVCERPPSFGPVSSQPMPVPDVPTGLQRDRNRGNKVCFCSGHMGDTHTRYADGRNFTRHEYQRR